MPKLKIIYDDLSTTEDIFQLSAVKLPKGMGA